MLTQNRILVPFDFSPCSRAALQYALYLTDHFGGTIDILHVVSADPDEKDARASEAKRKLERVLADMPQLAALVVRFRVVMGDPVDEIVKQADSEHDLVVIGGHGVHTHTGRGPTTRAVADKCWCTVLPIWRSEDARGFPFALGPPSAARHDVH